MFIVCFSFLLAFVCISERRRSLGELVSICVVQLHDFLDVNKITENYLSGRISLKVIGADTSAPET